ncbi:nucleobase:cation symporter-2 family protein [Clostridium tagluense]|uniref:nucleobase:cation symporter-2 family protein n=1 Tax=Clostridium tagluense TaxID=360422 RepID=UPI001CF4E45E|nr:nucleobase:cation symporter-2 family protein [Clostridium tagluense]MCB2297489.1 purine permease [Clostridium tagluense]
MRKRSLINKKTNTKNNDVDSILPFKKLFPLGLQHVLAMYAGAVAVPLILGGALGLNSHQITLLIAADLFTCGIATLLQSFGIGNLMGIKLPVILACSFIAVSPMISIGKEYGLTTIYGSVIVAGIILALLAPVFGKVIRIFSPVVTGSLITVVGLSLTSVAFNSAAGGAGSKNFGDPKNIALAAFTLTIILIINKYSKGFVQSIAVLIGLIIGTIVGSFMGMVNFSGVNDASWLHIVTPFYFGAPVFRVDGIITMTIVSLITAVEALGVFIAVGDIVEKPPSTEALVKGIRAEGIAQLLGGIFNSFPYSTFSQNVGLLVLSKVRTRFVCVCAGGILITLGLIPKFAALATTIPAPVLGGATLVMFGMVAVTGMRILSTVDMNKSGNLLIIASAVALGMGGKIAPTAFAQLPHFLKMILEEGPIAAAITAIILNIFFNWKEIFSSSKPIVPIPDDLAL